MATAERKVNRWGSKPGQYRSRRQLQAAEPVQGDGRLGGMGASSPLDAIQAFNAQARQQFLAGDPASARASLDQAEGQNDALAQAQGAPTGLEDDFRVSEGLLAGQMTADVSGTTADISPQSLEETHARIAQAIANQPGLLDQLAAHSLDFPLSAVAPALALLAPNATVGDALTWYGGYTSALGITTPQSGADARAQDNAQKNIKAATDNLPWPLSWIWANPKKFGALVAGGTLLVYGGPPAIRVVKSWAKAVRS